MAKKILMIVGSLRTDSYNQQLAGYAASYMRDRAEVSFLDYRSLPFMDQDIEFPAPEAVAWARQQVLDADGIWIVTAEYNHSYPGHLKNLLDWLSRPLKQGDSRENNAIVGKKVMLSGVAGKSSAAGVLENMKTLLPVIFAVPLDGAEGYTYLGGASENGALILSDEMEDRLRAQAEKLLSAINE